VSHLHPAGQSARGVEPPPQDAYGRTVWRGAAAVVELVDVLVDDDDDDPTGRHWLKSELVVSHTYPAGQSWVGAPRPPHWPIGLAVDMGAVDVLDALVDVDVVAWVVAA